MNSNRLIRMKDLMNTHKDLFDANTYNPVDQTAYGANNEKIGTITGALVEETTGKIRYLIVDAGGWFSSKQVVIPVGLATFQNDGVYLQTLTKEQVQNMREYNDMTDYNYDNTMIEQDKPLLAANTVSEDMRTRAYDSPNTLQLLEERLIVNKDRYVAGSVEIGKHVETQQQQVNVELQSEQIVVDRRPVDARPVNATLGADAQTIRVDLEAERANVGKQAYVVEEVAIGKTAQTHTQTVTETIGKEVLDINETGDINRVAADQTRTPQKR